MSEFGTPDHRTGNDGRGFYIRTFTGKQFYWDDIESNAIDIKDIAHSLAMNCRWTGHCREFYSVAQHCIYASLEAPSGKALKALLHDAAEAYIHDTPSPLKWHLKEHGFTEFSKLEKRIQAHIFRSFGVDPSEDPEVKEVDLRLLATEKRQLMPPGPEESWMRPPYDWKIRCLLPQDAEVTFLRRFHRINRENFHDRRRRA